MPEVRTVHRSSSAVRLILAVYAFVGGLVSFFAYVADGRNGLRILQLVSANTTPGAFGFSPRPAPTLIATYRTRSPAIAISKGLDRDRAVDESGNQIAVFGRRGARPFNLEEMRRLFLRGKQVWTVTNDGK